MERARRLRAIGRGPRGGIGMRLLKLLAALTALVISPAWAQNAEVNWPTKPIRFIVPFPAGSAVAVVARLMGQRIGPRLGQLLVVDNRVGASGSVGSLAISRSAP